MVCDKRINETLKNFFASKTERLAKINTEMKWRNADFTTAVIG